jgi:hypothetical protein
MLLYSAQSLFGSISILALCASKLKLLENLIQTRGRRCRGGEGAQTVARPLPTVRGCNPRAQVSASWLTGTGEPAQCAVRSGVSQRPGAQPPRSRRQTGEPPLADAHVLCFPSRFRHIGRRVWKCCYEYHTHTKCVSQKRVRECALRCVRRSGGLRLHYSIRMKLYMTGILINFHDKM